MKYFLNARFVRLSKYSIGLESLYYFLINILIVYTSAISFTFYCDIPLAYDVFFFSLTPLRNSMVYVCVGV